MEHATLIEWRITPGESIQAGQAIAEVETDKVDMEIEAPFSGVVESLRLHPGDQLEVGGILATVSTDEADLLGFLDRSVPHNNTENERQDDASTKANPGGIVKAAPAARSLARRNDVDLALIAATGTRSQVTVEDVQRHMAEARQQSWFNDHSVAPASSEPTRDEQATPTVAAAGQPNLDRRSANRRATATVVSRSALIPQFTLHRQLDLTRAAADKGGESWTTVFVRALADALRQHPELNGQWSEDAGLSVQLDAVRVGIAVDRPGLGLAVVSVSDPDRGDRARADRLVRQVVDRVRTGRANPQDLAPAGVTLSNLGGLGVDRFNAMLMPPQALIMAAGTIKMRPVATAGGGVRAALTCDVGLTVDHRAADGADGARFLDTFCETVERSRC